MNSGVKPQKQMGISGLELQWSSTVPVNFFRAQSLLGGTQFSFGGGTSAVWGHNMCGLLNLFRTKLHSMVYSELHSVTSDCYSSSVTLKTLYCRCRVGFTQNTLKRRKSPYNAHANTAK